MKKYTIAILLLIITALHSQAQTYTVLKVLPKDKAQANGENIAIGAKLNASDNIAFTDKEAFLRVFDGKDTYTINQAGKLNKVLNQKQALMSAYGSRAVIVNLQDLQDLLQMPKFVVIDTFKQRVPMRFFRLEKWTSKPESKFCFIEYTYKGEQISKFLKVGEKNSFVIDRSLYIVDGKAINPSEATDLVFKYAINSEKVQEIAEMDIVMLRTEDIKDEIKAMLDHLKKDKTKEGDIIPVLKGYFKENYGNIDADHLKEWLAKW